MAISLGSALIHTKGNFDQLNDVLQTQETGSFLAISLGSALIHTKRNCDQLNDVLQAQDTGFWQ